MFGGVGGNDYLCYITMTPHMIENAVKKYFKDKLYSVSGCGFDITYKVNVNTRLVKTVSGVIIKHIDLNVRVVKCTSVYYHNTTGNIFDVTRRRNYDYSEIRMVVREDLNRWFGKIFTTYFYRDISTRLCEGVEIGLNKFTYK
jgi:hypothetical protein